MHTAPSWNAPYDTSPHAIPPAVPVALRESRNSPVTCNLEIVEEASDERPETVSVPFEVRDEVAVIDPPVTEEKVAVIALRSVVKKLDEVALVFERFVIVPVEE